MQQLETLGLVHSNMKSPPTKNSSINKGQSGASGGMEMECVLSAADGNLAAAATNTVGVFVSYRSFASFLMEKEFKDWQKTGGAVAFTSQFSLEGRRARLRCLQKKSDLAELKFDSMKRYWQEAPDYIATPVLNLRHVDRYAGSTVLIHVSWAYSWAVCVVEFALFCGGNPTMNLTGQRLVEAFLDFLAIKYRSDRPFCASLFDTAKLTAFDPTKQTFHVPDNGEATLSSLLGACLTGQESHVAQVLQGIAAWIYPVGILPVVPHATSSVMAPMTPPQTPAQQYPAPDFYAGSPLFMPQLRFPYHGVTSAMSLPGLLPNFVSMPATHQHPAPPPQQPQPGFPQAEAKKLVERILKELQGLRMGQERLQTSTQTGFQNAETGMQNEFQTFRQSLMKRGSDGGEPGVPVPNKKTPVGDEDQESWDHDDSVPSPTKDPSLVVHESGTVCGEYQVSEILQYTRVKGKVQGQWIVLSGNGTIRFLPEHSTELVRVEHLEDEKLVYSGYLKYYTPRGAVGAEKRVARLFEGHGGLESGELVEEPDSSLVISSVKVNSRVELSKYSFRYKLVDSRDMNELLGMTKSSFNDDK